LGRLTEVVNAAMLFEIHFTRMMGSLCRGATFMVNLEHLQYTEWNCSVIFAGDHFEGIVLQSVIM